MQRMGMVYSYADFCAFFGFSGSVNFCPFPCLRQGVKGRSPRNKRGLRKIHNPNETKDKKTAVKKSNV